MRKELSINLHNEIVKKIKSREQIPDVVKMSEEMKDCKVEIVFVGLNGGYLTRSVRVFDKDFNWERDVNVQ